MASQGNCYNDEFKVDIIRLIREENQSVNKVAKDFGVNNQTIRNWLKAEDEKWFLKTAILKNLRLFLEKRKRKTLIYSKLLIY